MRHKKEWFSFAADPKWNMQVRSQTSSQRWLRSSANTAFKYTISQEVDHYAVGYFNEQPCRLLGCFPTWNVDLESGTVDIKVKHKRCVQRTQPSWDDQPQMCSRTIGVTLKQNISSHIRWWYLGSSKHKHVALMVSSVCDLAFCKPTFNTWKTFKALTCR